MYANNLYRCLTAGCATFLQVSERPPLLPSNQANACPDLRVCGTEEQAADVETVTQRLHAVAQEVLRLRLAAVAVTNLQHQVTGSALSAVWLSPIGSLLLSLTRTAAVEEWSNLV